MSAAKVTTSFQEVDGLVTKITSELPQLGPREILVKITHSGVCGTDLLAGAFHSALGHEGVGVVQGIGSNVTQFKIGDRAGGGFLRNSCGHCKHCLSGKDMWCYERDIYLESDISRHSGTFSDYYIGTETYMHHIPDAISSEHAAPLQCAGATVYTALVDNVKPGQRVGVYGIGGLGHLAIQFAAKMGCEVVVFSSTQSKEQEAREFGAREFYLSQDPGSIAKPIEVLILTANAYPDWDKFVDKNVLQRQGVIVPLSVPGPMELPGFPMLFNGYTVKMSLVASRKVHDDMLEFAAYHSIKPTTETFELSAAGIDAAYGKLRTGGMRYRGVLVAV